MVKNKRQRQFLDHGIITTISSQELTNMLDNMKGKNLEEAKAMVITMYYTGARPNEILKLKGKHIYKEGMTVFINLEGSKQGLPRKIQLPYQRPLVKEIYNYAIRNHTEMLLFYHFRTVTVKFYKTKKGEIRKYIEISSLLRYYFKKWFKGKIIPYFLRHNCFSMLAELGYTDADIKYLKGAKTIASVQPYSHLSAVRAKKLKFGFNKF